MTIKTISNGYLEIYQSGLWFQPPTVSQHNDLLQNDSNNPRLGWMHGDTEH